MKMCELLKKKDVGSIGIGAMIVFIAMVLVAGIAASVLIQTSTKLETQAMQSGQETIAEVSGGIAVFDVCGKKGDSGDLGNMSITVRARAGSPQIDLNHTVIIMSDGVQKVLLTYYGDTNSTNYDSSVDSDGDLFGTGSREDLTKEYFGIIVLEDADGSCSRFSPAINTGDKVVLTVRCGAVHGTYYKGAFGREIPERTDIFGQVIPEIGSPGIIAFTTPATYSDSVFDLQ